MNSYLPNGAHAGYTWPKNQYATIQVDALNSTPLSYASAAIGILKQQSQTSGTIVTLFRNADGTVMLIVNSLPYVGYGTSEGVGLPYGWGNYLPGYNPTQQPNSIIWPWQPGWVVLPSVPFTAGDTFGIACKGTTYYLLHNGTVIANWIDSTNYDCTASGPNGGSLNIYGTAYTDVKLSNFVGGQVS